MLRNTLLNPRTQKAVGGWEYCDSPNLIERTRVLTTEQRDISVLCYRQLPAGVDLVLHEVDESAP